MRPPLQAAVAPGRRRRGRSAAARVVLSALAGALVLSVSLPGRTQRQQEPWDLPAGTTDQGLRQKYNAKRSYWWELYLKASQIVDKQGKGLKPEEVEEAIDKLRLSITERGRSQDGLGRGTPTPDAPYVPYFLLARMLTQAGDVEGALRCLDREASFGVIQKAPGTMPRDFETLRGKLKTLGLVVGLRQPLQGWIDTGNLSGPGVQQARRILELVDQFLHLQRPDADATPIWQGMLELVRIETERLAARIAGLTSGEWASVPGLSRATADACSAPGGSPTFETAQRGMERLVGCFGATRQVMLSAGSGACKVLEASRSDLAQVRGKLGEWQASAPPGTDPAIPSLCESSDWANLEFASAWDAVDRLAFAETKNAFAGRIADLRAVLVEVQGEFRARLEGARGKLLAASEQCALDLKLGRINRQLIGFQAQIDAALNLPPESLKKTPELDAAIGGIDQAVAGFRAGVRDGVADALDPAKNLQCKAEPAAVNAALGGFDSRPSSSTLTGLCREIRAVKQAITVCQVDKIDDVARQLDVYREAIRVASGWTPALSERRPECVEEARGEMPGAPPRGGAAAQQWVTRASSAGAQAGDCLTDYRAEHLRWMNDVLAALETGPVPDEWASNPRVKRMVADVTAAQRSLEAVRTLVPLDEDSISAEALRQSVQESKLTVADSLWRLLDRVEQPAERAQILLAIRDEAVNAPFTAADGVLARWRPLLEGLGDLTSLDSAFREFGSGDLDDAIRILREGLGGGRQPAGKSAALGHVALAYFLHTKLLLLDDEQRAGSVGELLLADATREARAALEVQPQFRLPTRLIDSEPFRKFFEDCRAM